jgi:hypothetical protein
MDRLDPPIWMKIASSRRSTLWWALEGKGRGNSGSVEAVVGVWPGLRVWTNLCRAIALSWATGST